MPNDDYVSSLDGDQIENALEAIDGVADAANNGKVLYIENGQIKAASASRWGGGYPEPTGTITLTENGLHNVKDYAEANVQVQGGGSDIEVIPLSVTENNTYIAPAGKAYSPVTVNVSGGSSTNPAISTLSSVAYGYMYPFGADNDSTWGSNGGSQEVLSLFYDSPVSITEVSFGNTFIEGNYHWCTGRVVFQYSDDGSNWTNLFDVQNLTDDVLNYYTQTISNSGSHQYYRFVCYKGGQYWACLKKVMINVN